MSEKFNRAKESALTSDQLRQFLDYDPETGKFYWKVARKKGTRVGAPAGTLRTDGYVAIFVSGQHYKAHRLAWLYVHGQWPINEIDHINGNKADNRITNLRNATSSQNTINRPLFRNNKSGVRGVRFHPPLQKWHARIMFNRTQKHLGYFHTLEEADAAYRAAQMELHGTSIAYKDEESGYVR